MTSKRIAQTNQQQKSEKPQASGILQPAAVRSVSDTEAQSTNKKEVQPLGNSACSKDFSRVPISTTRPQPIMTKLMIGAVGDKYEQEADRVASQVVQQINTPSAALPNRLKIGIENLSGYSMDDVKVHYNSDKPAQLNAHAYAQGTNIHIASGQEKHLPHEAWHVVQQKQGKVKPTMQMKGKVNINDDVSFEKEADVMGEKALQIITGNLGHQSRHLAQASSINATAQRSISVHSLNNGELFDKEIDFVKENWRFNKEEREVYRSWLKDEIERHFRDEPMMIEIIKKQAETPEKMIFFQQEGLPQGEGDSGGIRAMVSKFGSLAGIQEFYSSVTSGPRVKRHNTSAWITGRITNGDYTKIYVPIKSIRSQHSIDGAAVGNTEIRAKSIQTWLDESKNQDARSMDMETLNRLAGSTGSIKVGWNGDDRYITLDGVGRLEAIRKALKDLKKESSLEYVEAYVVKLSDDEFNQLDYTSGFFRDSQGEQRDTPEHDLYRFSALPRFIVGTGMNLLKNSAIPRLGNYLSPLPDRKIPIQRK